MTPNAPWKVIHVDLSKTLTALTIEDQFKAAFVVYRFDALVLGYDYVLAEEFPLAAAELPNRAAAILQGNLHSWNLVSTGKELPAPTPRRDSYSLRKSLANAPLSIETFAARIAERNKRPIEVTASIVICTRRRAQDLAKCLDSIAQEIAAGTEVIVVDNGPDAETEVAVRAHPTVKYVVAPIAGLSRARNVGVKSSTKDVVVFVDDDVRPEPGWIEPLLRNFTDPKVAVVCGMVLPDTLDTAGQIGFQFDLGFGGMGHLPLRFDRDFIEGGWTGVPVWSIGAGANMAVRRQSVVDLGGFDERLGPGALGGCGDDSEFWHRALFAGFEAVYEPLSVVRHQHRREMKDLKRQAYGYSFGHSVALMAQYARGRDKGDLARLLGTFPLWLLRRLLRQPLRAFRGNPDILLADWISGYVKSLRHLGLVFDRSPRDWLAKDQSANGKR